MTFVFSVIYVELLHRHAITGRIWFECVWVELFWLLHLGGATAVTVLYHHVCNSTPLIQHDFCTSTRLLVAFTWFMSVILLSYFSVVVLLTLFCMREDPAIWDRYIHKFPWNLSRRPIPRSVTSRLHRESVLALKSTLSVQNAVYAPRVGVGSNEMMKSDLSTDEHTLPSRASSTLPKTAPPSLYPHHIQAILQPLPMHDPDQTEIPELDLPPSLSSVNTNVSHPSPDLLGLQQNREGPFTVPVKIDSPSGLNGHRPRPLGPRNIPHLFNKGFMFT